MTAVKSIVEDKYAELRPVPRVSIHDLTPSRFNREFKRWGRPVVITQALESAIPVDIDKLVSLVGDIEVSTREYGAERFSLPKTEWKSYCEVQRRTIAQYCELLKDGSAKARHIYLALVEMGHTPLRQLIGPCIDLIERNTGLRKQPHIDMNLWVGPCGHVEPLHFDGLDGTLSQFKGTKRVSLFSPSQTSNLYPFPISNGKMPATFSQPYIDQPDFSAYPRLATALKHRKTIVLAEGETLYIPVGWWHEVESLGEGNICSINRFWGVDPVLRYAMAPRAALFQFLSKMMRTRKIKS